MRDLRDDTRAGFLDTFGREPVGLWTAPGRVNLIGEHTDYNLGFVLPFAIGLRTAVALDPRDDRVVRVASALSEEVAEIHLDDLHPEMLSGWSAYVFGVVWALGEFGADLAAVPGFDAFIDSDVPIGAGLSSSAAIECAVAVALNDSWQLRLDRRTLAAVGQFAENHAVGAPTGVMDQTASLLGEHGAAVFLDCRSGTSEIVPMHLAEAGLEILVIDSGVSHEHATGGYADRRASCDLAAQTLGIASLRELTEADLPDAATRLDPVTLRRVRHVVTENQRVLDTVALLRQEGAAAIGDLLDASHRSMRFDFEISVPELDLAVETAQSNGAIGARMTGGGFGGAAIALVPDHAVSHLRAAIDGAFAEHGFGQPDMFLVHASHGAIREE
ncbi:galactokinase [Homoserinimonas sp. OAct 916]|uniref:galactokinase n=1 Tax=Homoserinimonas sp. OAct 916 TaxID=2211450 RepID=UPI000DBE2359|nr:galactokinase [Homoserinimonas sp. OAct 916]